MAQVLGAGLAQRGRMAGGRAVFGEEAAVGGGYVLHEFHRRLNPPFSRVGGPGDPAMPQFQQVSHRRPGGPAGLAVVAQIDGAAGRQPIADQIDDHPAAGVGHPAPHPMQGDDVEQRQIGTRREIRERRRHQSQVAARRLRQPSSVGHMIRIDVHAPEQSLVRRGMHGQGHALADAQLQIGRGGGHGAIHPRDQAAEPQVRWPELVIAAGGVFQLRIVAFGHGDLMP